MRTTIDNSASLYEILHGGCEYTGNVLPATPVLNGQQLTAFDYHLVIESTFCQSYVQELTTYELEEKLDNDPELNEVIVEVYCAMVENGAISQNGSTYTVHTLNNIGDLLKGKPTFLEKAEIWLNRKFPIQAKVNVEGWTELKRFIFQTYVSRIWKIYSQKCQFPRRYDPNVYRLSQNDDFIEHAKVIHAHRPQTNPFSLRNRTINELQKRLNEEGYTFDKGLGRLEKLEDGTTRFTLRTIPMPTADTFNRLARQDVKDAYMLLKELRVVSFVGEMDSLGTLHFMQEEQKKLVADYVKIN